MLQKKENNNDESMIEELKISLEDRLKDIGVNEILIDELVSAAVRVNYGQVMITFLVKYFILNSAILWDNNIIINTFSIFSVFTLKDAKGYSCLCRLRWFSRNAW